MKYILKNIKLLDAFHDYESLEILIEDDRIKEVSKNISADDAKVIDLKGKTLMPSFADAHMHIKPFMGPFENENPILEALALNGISCVKDLGILDSIPLEGYLKWLDTLKVPGNIRISTAGRYIDVEGGYGMGPVPDVNWGILINTPEEAADAVTYQFLAGVDGIKIGLNDGSFGPITGKLSPELIYAITTRARECGIWSTAHVLAADDLRTLVDCGIDSAAHTPQDKLIDDDVIDKMVKNHIPMTTTIGTASLDDPLPEMFPPSYASAEAFRQAQADRRQMILKNIEKFYKAGGIINVGTDLMRCQNPINQATIPVSELKQLRNIVGMSMKDVIKAGTINSARACGFNDEGVLRPGNKASLIAFAGTLSDSFDELLNLDFVMNQGIILKNI
ncbi:MAG: amidohydrolase family protein [Eubacterium sp.]|nr:amidohydrolase family protein [Eubacterium sp.]